MGKVIVPQRHRAPEERGVNRTQYHFLYVSCCECGYYAGTPDNTRLWPLFWNRLFWLARAPKWCKSRIRDKFLYRVSPQKAERSIFVTLIFLLWFHQIKHCLLKRMIPRSLKLVEKLWFYGHFSKHSHCQFSLHSRDISVKDNGFSDFHTLLPGSPLIRANKTKRELMDCYIPAVNSSRRFSKLRKWRCFKKWL